MKNIGIFYGTATGTTEHIAKMLAKKLDVEASDVYDVVEAKADKMNDYNILLFGCSTQGYGDLQDDWEDFIKDVKKANLAGKKVGVFGLGDSSTYADTFCDAIGTIADAATKAGATLIGDKVDVADYSFDESTAAKDGYFVGLALDEDNEYEKTEARVDSWISQIKVAF